jgi:hypothetical protein
VGETVEITEQTSREISAVIVDPEGDPSAEIEMFNMGSGWLATTVTRCN